MERRFAVIAAAPALLLLAIPFFAQDASQAGEGVEGKEEAGRRKRPARPWNQPHAGPMGESTWAHRPATRILGIAARFRWAPVRASALPALGEGFVRLPPIESEVDPAPRTSIAGRLLARSTCLRLGLKSSMRPTSKEFS